MPEDLSVLTPNIDQDCESRMQDSDDDSDYEQGKLSTDSKKIKKNKKVK